VKRTVTRFLRGLNQIIFRDFAIGRYVREDVDSRSNARVILEFGDDDSSPALVEKSFGEGRVLLYCTAADDEWSNFPRSFLFLPLVQESARYVVRPDPDQYTLPVGAPIIIRYDPKRMGPQVAVVPPNGTAIRILSEQDQVSKQLFYRFDNTIKSGPYTVRLKTPDGEDFTRPYAFNVEPSEGNLRRANLAGIESAVPGVRLERASDEAAFDTDASDRTEFWRTLIWALVIVAGLETLLAWRFGHHKSSEHADESKQVFVR